jgi:hypothetical protein
MPRYLWNIDADGCPVERIDTLSVQHVPVFTGQPEEVLSPQDGGRPLAYIFPRVTGAGNLDCLAQFH